MEPSMESGLRQGQGARPPGLREAAGAQAPPLLYACCPHSAPGPSQAPLTCPTLAPTPPADTGLLLCGALERHHTPPLPPARLRD